jgi:ketosteroid isomerase-like protein
MSIESDTEEILAVHWDWFESNRGLDVERMRRSFADPGFLQFSLSGSITRGIEAKVRGWTALRERGFDFGELSVVEQPILHVSGDLAYLTVVWSSRLVGQIGDGTVTAGEDPIIIRVTEVYRRDDGKGERVWKIWHFHGSQGIAEPAPEPADSVD